MSRVTSDDRAFAETLLDAAEAYAQDDRPEVRRVAVNTIAKLIADVHERAVACALIRVEQEMHVRFSRRATKEKSK